MLKTFTIIAATAFAAAALPSVAFAQTEKGAMGGDSMSKGSMGDMKSKPMMMKKHKMMHHSMHRGMMKKPMTSGGGM